MTTQREGLVGDIFNKVKDLLTDDDRERKDKTPPQDDPPLETQCCGPLPPGLIGKFEHDAGCPNHPDNLAKEEEAAS